MEVLKKTDLVEHHPENFGNWQEKRDIFSIELIKTGIKILKDYPRSVKSKYGYKEYAWRSLVVYLLTELDDGFLPLNRDYKPIGLQGYGNWTKYESYSFLVIPKKRVRLHGLNYIEGLTKGWWFFDDSNTPINKRNVESYIELATYTFGIKCLVDD